MITPPLFVDDPEVASRLDAAIALVADHLADLLPPLADPAHPLRALWRERLAITLCQTHDGQPALLLGTDAFGDPFDLAALPLPRRADGYAVQWLGSDTLLDRTSSRFLAVRDPSLQALHPTFSAAYASARAWLVEHGADSSAPLAIVPAARDPQLERHILIHGVVIDAPPSIADGTIPYENA
jgi:hypothetical protein